METFMLLVPLIQAHRDIDVLQRWKVHVENELEAARERVAALRRSA